MNPSEATKKNDCDIRTSRRDQKKKRGPGPSMRRNAPEFVDDLHRKPLLRWGIAPSLASISEVARVTEPAVCVPEDQEEQLGSPLRGVNRSGQVNKVDGTAQS